VTYKSGVCGETLRIVVIGGGFTGAVFVIHAISATARPLDIVVIEPAGPRPTGQATPLIVSMSRLIAW
jgi:glycine/D-amino acid oxidase-like deaminating enzyme